MMVRLPVSVVLGVILGACAAPQTLLQSVDASALAAASTYAIEPPPPGTIGADTRHEGERLRTSIEGEIARVLDGKGYGRSERETADLRVSYRLVSMARLKLDEREDAVAESRVGPGPGDPYGSYHPLPESAQGERHEMLLVTITDRRSATIVWQATNEGLATSAGSAVSEVSRAAREALAKVPKSQPRHP